VFEIKGRLLELERYIKDPFLKRESELLDRYLKIGIKTTLD